MSALILKLASFALFLSTSCYIKDEACHRQAFCVCRCYCWFQNSCHNPYIQAHDQYAAKYCAVWRWQKLESYIRDITGVNPLYLGFCRKGTLLVSQPKFIEIYVSTFLCICVILFNHIYMKTTSIFTRCAQFLIWENPDDRASRYQKYIYIFFFFNHYLLGQC